MKGLAFRDLQLEKFVYLADRLRLRASGSVGAMKRSGIETPRTLAELEIPRFTPCGKQATE